MKHVTWQILQHDWIFNVNLWWLISLFTLNFNLMFSNSLWNAKWNFFWLIEVKFFKIAFQAFTSNSMGKLSGSSDPLNFTTDMLMSVHVFTNESRRKSKTILDSKCWWQRWYIHTDAHFVSLPEKQNFHHSQMKTSSCNLVNLYLERIWKS